MIMENVGNKDGNGKATCDGGDTAERDDAVPILKMTSQDPARVLT